MLFKQDWLKINQKLNMTHFIQRRQTIVTRLPSEDQDKWKANKIRSQAL